MANLYNFGVHKNLGAPELFVFVGLDETCKELGLSDLAGASAILLGQNDVPVAGKLAGSVAGTSVVSLAMRKVLPFQLKRALPTIVKGGEAGLRIAMTRNLGAFVGRAIPVVGTVLLTWDAVMIMRMTVIRYNGLVKVEDRVL